MASKLVESDVDRLVRDTVLHVASPLTVNGQLISDPDDVDPGWNIGIPAPIGMDGTRQHILAVHLDAVVKSLKRSAKFGPGDLKPTMDIGDLQDAVWAKVKP